MLSTYAPLRNGLSVHLIAFFCVWSAGDQELEIAYFGDGCGGQPAQNVSGALSMLTPDGAANANLTIDTGA